MSHSKTRLVLAALSCCTFLSLAGAAQASTVTSGNLSVVLGNPQPTETQIFLDSDTDTTLGTGHPGSQTATPLISFSTDVGVDLASGNATITPSLAQTFNSLTVSMPAGWTFDDLEFSTLGAEQVTVTASNGGTYSNDGLGNGLQAFLVNATSGTFFTWLTIASSDGFDQIKQFAISGLTCPTCGPAPGPGTTPIVGSVTLFTSGLGLLGVLGWRRKKRLARRLKMAWS